MQLTRLLHYNTLRNEETPGDAGGDGISNPGEPGNSGDGGPNFGELPTLVDAELNLAEGYQQIIGEYAEGTTYKNLKDVFKSNKEVQSALTRKSEEAAQLRKQLEELGNKPPAEIPETVEEFRKQLQLPQELPDGYQLDEDVLNAAAEYAMEKGYGPKELSDFLAFDLKRLEMEDQRSKNEEFTRIESAKASIIEQVGEQNYDMTIANAKFVAEALQLPLQADDLVTQPNMVVSLAKLRKSLSEGTLKGASVGGVEISNGSKLEQANAIVSDPNHPLHDAFYDSSHPQYEWAHQEHARLIAESAK